MRQMRSVSPRSITCRGVEPSKAGLGCFSHGPMASAETSFSSDENRRLISVRRRSVEELGLVPWDQLETARNEKPVIRARASWEILNRLASSLTGTAPEPD